MQPVVTDRVAWSFGRFVCHTSEPCKNGRTDQDAVWVEKLGGPKEHVLDGVQITAYCKSFLSLVNLVAVSLHCLLILECGPIAQRDGRPAKYRWRPLFNAAKFG